MARSIVGVFAGFFTWFVVLIGGEQVLSLLMPERFRQTAGCISDGDRRRWDV